MKYEYTGIMNMKRYTNLSLPKAHNNSIPGKTKKKKNALKDLKNDNLGKIK